MAKILESIEFSVDSISGTIQHIDDLGYRYWRVVIIGAQPVTSRNFSSYEKALEALNSYTLGGTNEPPANHHI